MMRCPEHHCRGVASLTRAALAVIALIVCGVAYAGETTRHGRVGEYVVIENERAFLALTASTTGSGGAFSFGCAKSTALCGHLLHFPASVAVPAQTEHVVFKVDGGVIHIIGAMRYPKPASGAALVLSDLSLESSSTFINGTTITFWPGVASGAMPGAEGSRTFSLAGYRESVRTVRAMQASYAAGHAPTIGDHAPRDADDDRQQMLRRAIRARDSDSSQTRSSE